MGRESAMQKDMPVFQWLGTAGFRIEFRGSVILIDPYLTRNERARPVQDLRPADFSDADTIFLTHGHLDHAFDVPAIVAVSGADVFCSAVAASTLTGKGVSAGSITVLAGGERIDVDGVGVRTMATRHIVFDLPLVAATLKRSSGDILDIAREGKEWPAGPVMIYFFDFDEIRVAHMGSLGFGAAGVRARGFPEVDILMVPLQGHTDIIERAAALVETIRPPAVVAQHHDDFAPPLSQAINIDPMRKMLAGSLPGCAFYEPAINERFTAADVFAAGKKPGRVPVPGGDTEVE